MPLLTNPYTAGDPVGKTDLFVGREDVLREVMRMLKHPTQNAITLYGQRRIGKTSILQYLEVHLPEQGAYQPVYFDLMHKAGLPIRKILRDLGRSIALKLNLPEGKLENISEKSFRESYLPGILQKLSPETKLVLLLDEFDVLADPQAEQQSKRGFFSYLRDLRQLDPQRLKFIFVLGRNLDDLDVIAQGLFKDLPFKRVSLLDQRDAELLVRLSERYGSLVWNQDAALKIWELASGHPYLTQALCSQIWEDTHEENDHPESVQDDDVENAIMGTLMRSQNMFAWLWEGLGPAEKVAAAALAGVGPKIVDEDQLADILAHSRVRILIGELQNAPKTLEKWDILIPVDGGYRFRVELLRRWIVENKPLSRTQDELDRINPVADFLFKAAFGYYRDNNLEEAEPLLRQALTLNAHHLSANELLAEILFNKNKLDEAQQVLERLEEIAPVKARRRLKQVYLKHAEIAQNGDEKLEWYDKILTLLPNDIDARIARTQLYQELGEQALNILKVFICHTSADNSKVSDLYEYLTKHRIQVWLDVKNLLPGQKWRDEILKSLDKSNVIIICISQNSLDKEGYVQKEIKFALDKALEIPESHIYIIPARLEKCEVHRSLNIYQWVDLFDDDGYEKLMLSLKLRASQLQSGSATKN